MRVAPILQANAAGDYRSALCWRAVKLSGRPWLGEQRFADLQTCRVSEPPSRRYCWIATFSTKYSDSPKQALGTPLCWA